MNRQDALKILGERVTKWRTLRDELFAKVEEQKLLGITLVKGDARFQPASFRIILDKEWALSAAQVPSLDDTSMRTEVVLMKKQDSEYHIHSKKEWGYDRNQMWVCGPGASNWNELCKEIVRVQALVGK